MNFLDLPEDIRAFLCGLTINELFRLYECGVRCSHYCPVECHCFDEFEMKVDYSIVKAAIRHLYIGEY